MTQDASLEQSYMVLIKFLMLSKHRLLQLGVEHDISGVQAITLFLLDEPRPMNGFKKIYNCDASNVTGIIDGLEEKGLAGRYEHASDRRIKMVQLTVKGRRLRSALVGNLTTRENPLLSRLDDNELKTLVKLLEKITRPAAHI